MPKLFTCPQTDKEQAVFEKYIVHNIYCRRVRKIAKSDSLASSCLSIRLSTSNNSAPTGGIFMEF